MCKDEWIQMVGTHIMGSPIQNPTWEQVEKYIYMTYEKSDIQSGVLSFAKRYDPVYTIGKAYTSCDQIYIFVEAKLFRLSVYFSNQKKEEFYLFHPKKQLDIPDWVVIKEDKTPRQRVSDDIEKAVSFFREFFETGTVTLDEFELY